MDTYPFRNFIWGEDREWEYLRRKTEYQRDFNNFIVGLPAKKYPPVTWFHGLLPNHPIIISVNNESLTLASFNKWTAEYIRLFRTLSDKWCLKNILINPDIPYDAMLNMCKSVCEKENRPLEYPNIFIAGYGKTMHLNAAIWPNHIKFAIPKNPRNMNLIIQAIKTLCNEDIKPSRLHEDKWLQDLRVYDLRKAKTPYIIIATSVYPKKNPIKAIQAAKKAYERVSREIEGKVDELAQIDTISAKKMVSCEKCPDYNKCKKVCPTLEREVSKYEVKQQHYLPETPIGF